MPKDFRVKPDITVTMLVSANTKKEATAIATAQLARVIAAGANALNIPGKTTFSA